MVLGKDEVVGHSITSFFEAYDLAKEYKKCDKELEIVISKHISELINIDDEEMSVIAKKFDLPTDIFQGLTDKVLLYKEEHKDKRRSFESFMVWLRAYNETNFTH